MEMTSNIYRYNLEILSKIEENQTIYYEQNKIFVDDRYLSQCHFIHFFLKDKLPKRGENVERLMLYING